MPEAKMDPKKPLSSISASWCQPWKNYNLGQSRDEIKDKVKPQPGDKQIDFYLRTKSPCANFFLGNHDTHALERIVPVDKIHVIPLSIVSGGMNGGRIGANFLSGSYYADEIGEKPGTFGRRIGKGIGVILGVPVGVACGAVFGPVRWAMVETDEAITGRTHYY